MSARAEDVESPASTALAVVVDGNNTIDFDEAGLADASISGDSGAFEVLYNHYFPRVRGFCVRKLGDRELAEDVAQEAFVRAYERIADFGGPRHFGGWVSTIAANLCTDQLRRRKHTPISLEQVDRGPSYEVDPIRNVQREDNGRLVRTALDKLDPRHKEALLLHEVKGLSCAAVGRRLGISEVAAESLLARARRSLRKEITAKAAPADLFGVGGLAALPLFLRGWARFRASLTRRTAGVQAVAARGWEGVGAGLAPAVDGTKALVAAVGAGLVIGAATSAAPPVHRPDPSRSSTPVVSPASQGRNAGAAKHQDRSSVGARVRTGSGSPVGGSAGVSVPQVGGQNGPASGGLDLDLTAELAEIASTAPEAHVSVSAPVASPLAGAAPQQLPSP